MDDEIALFDDGDGLAVVGEPKAVERYLRSIGRWADSYALNLDRLKPLVATASNLLEAGADISANSARWIKLTEESAQLRQEHGLMDTKTPGVKHVMIGVPGEIGKWLQAEDGSATIFTNPAVLSGVAGLMAQVGQQQAIAQITDYLAKIDMKVDEILRKQDDAIVAQVIGVGFAIDEAWTIRDVAGTVNEVTWGKIESASGTIGNTQGYALRQLETIGKRIDDASKVSGMAKAASQAVPEVRQWLAVLAHCAELQGRLHVLELDRVLAVAPDELDLHRLALQTARRKRVELVADYTEPLLDRIDAACGTANARMLREWTGAHVVLEASNEVAAEVQEVHELLGIESTARSWEPRKVERAAELGAQALQQAKDKAPALIGAAALALALNRKDDPGPES